jgi:hypothetical protein
MGGQHREKTLAITRLDDYTVAWLCHRASCGFRGNQFTPGYFNLKDAFDSPPKVARDPRLLAVHHTLDVEKLSPHLAGYLTNKFESVSELHESAYMCGLRMIDADTITFALWSVHNRYLGQHEQRRTQAAMLGLTRQVWNRRAPHVDGPLYGCYKGPDASRNRIWLVEDCLSAIRLNVEGDATAISLLGTNVPESLVRDIMLTYPKDVEIILALDWDASTTALRQMRNLRANTGCDIEACLLRKDVKDMRRCDILKLVSDFEGVE